jgi:hypothetical protein
VGFKIYIKTKMNGTVISNTVKSLIFAGILFRVFVILRLFKSKIHVFGRVIIENPLNIFIFAGFIFAIMTPARNKTHTKISDFTVSAFIILALSPVSISYQRCLQPSQLHRHLCTLKFFQAILGAPGPYFGHTWSKFWVHLVHILGAPDPYFGCTWSIFLMDPYFWWIIIGL